MSDFQEIALEIQFEDRVGFIADVALAVADCGFNITSMELKKIESLSYLFIGAESSGLSVNSHSLFSVLENVQNVLTCKTIETLPHVERETRYKIVLDSISDGIISIDDKGGVTTMNRVAGDIFGVNRVDDMIGKDVSALNLNITALQKTVENKIITNMTEDIETDKGRFQYLSSCQPIIDAKDRVVGAVEIMKSVKEIQALADSVSKKTGITFDTMITKSQPMIDAIDFAQKVATTDSFVILRGESGTGKEVFAGAIHHSSGRNGKFIAINCAALPESLLESELFGFVGGAFTGADRKGKAGLFESAANGTVFLDEIAELPLNMQAKMLRVLQDKKVRRVGGDKEVDIDVRLICATNKNLESLVEQGLFREDLYYRINVFPVFIPPLRRRTEDIPVLVSLFLDQLNGKLDKQVSGLTKTAMDKLIVYDWKGNVRELKNSIERAFVLTASDIIEDQHLMFNDEMMVGGVAHFAQGTGQVHLKSNMDAYEKKLIEDALVSGKSIRQTAKDLGISHVALLNKIKKHQVVVK